MSTIIGYVLFLIYFFGCVTAHKSHKDLWDELLEEAVGEPYDEELLPQETDSSPSEDAVAEPGSKHKPRRSRVHTKIDSEEYWEFDSEKTNEQETRLAGVNDDETSEIYALLDQVLSEVDEAFPETSVGRSNGGDNERSKIMSLLQDVMQEVDIAERQRNVRARKGKSAYDWKEDETRTGLFSGSSSSSTSRSRGKRRWETGSGYTYRPQYVAPRDHKWVYGHGYEWPGSVHHNMYANSYRFGGTNGGGRKSSFGRSSSSSGQKDMEWMYGSGWIKKGTYQFREPGAPASRRSSSSRGGMLGRRRRRL